MSVDFSFVHNIGGYTFVYEILITFQITGTVSFTPLIVKKIITDFIRIMDTGCVEFSCLPCTYNKRMT